ncbi:MAG: DUF5615 family PIN-like protein [Planctomycetota bacterium]
MVAMLQEQGHDVLWAVHLEPAMPDDELLRLAFAEERLILTQDKGFGELVFRLELPAFGVILLRLSAPDEGTRVTRVRDVLPTISHHQPGHFITVTDHLVRSRPLETSHP